MEEAGGGLLAVGQELRVNHSPSPVTYYSWVEHSPGQQSPHVSHMGTIQLTSLSSRRLG